MCVGRYNKCFWLLENTHFLLQYYFLEIAYEYVHEAHSRAGPWSEKEKLYFPRQLDRQVAWQRIQVYVPGGRQFIYTFSI